MREEELRFKPIDLEYYLAFAHFRLYSIVDLHYIHRCRTRYIYPNKNSEDVIAEVAVKHSVIVQLIFVHSFIHSFSFLFLPSGVFSLLQVKDMYQKVEKKKLEGKGRS